MLIVTGYISVPPADLPRFLDEAGLLARVTRQRDGNLSYDIAVLDAAVGRLLVAERWRDEAALAAHLRANDTVAFVVRWEERMISDVGQYDADNGRPMAKT